MMRQLSDVYHHARDRALCGGASTVARLSIDVRCAIEESTLSQLFKPIKHAAIVKY